MSATRHILVGAAGAVLAAGAAGQERFKRTDAASGYVHLLELHDVDGRVVDPTAEPPRPYSPRETCKTCHEIESIHGGDHFAPRPGARAGEPWLLSDPRTATVLPVSRTGAAGARQPDAVGLDAAGFVGELGRHLPGGESLEVDCMLCHAADRTYRVEYRAARIAAGDLAWAPAVAYGLAKSGSPTAYDPKRFDGDGKVFFDVVRTPPDRACAYCHTVRATAGAAHWLDDGDVHTRAGLRCADCHRSGIDHVTVRGYEGETHPAGDAVATLSCRGCHLGEGGGRFGAPLPEHRGLPPLHLETMSCTACHAIRMPGAAAGSVQTSRAHGLGLASQTREADDLPRIAAPVLRRGADGIIRPERAVWPSFWGWRQGDRIEPIPPAEAYRTVRRALRVRRDLLRETPGEGPGFAAELRERVGKVLRELTEQRQDAVPVFVGGGAVHRLAAGGTELESTPHPAAAPFTWPIGHDVGPARHALGSGGCADCHSAASAFVHGTVEPLGPLADGAAARSMREWMELDPELTATWERAFARRETVKWVGIGAVAVVLAVLLLHALIGLGAIVRWCGRPRRREDA